MRLFNLFLWASSAGILLAGCSSHSESQDVAFEQEKLRQEITGDSTYYGDSNAQFPNLHPLKPGRQDDLAKGGKGSGTGQGPFKQAPIGEWAAFKLAVGQRIAHNANQIKVILHASGPDAKLAKKLTSLEKSNQAIQKEMAEYDGVLKPKWEKFKTGIDLGLFSIETELKDLARAEE